MTPKLNWRADCETKVYKSNKVLFFHTRSQHFKTTLDPEVCKSAHPDLKKSYLINSTCH